MRCGGTPTCTHFAPAGCMTLDRYATILEVNLTAAGLLGVDAPGWWTGISCSSCRKLQRRDFAAFLEEAFASCARQSCEILLLAGANRRRFVQIEARCCTSGEEWLLVLVDITAASRPRSRCASEHEYRALFDNSMEAVFLTEPNGAIKAANCAACTMFGMTGEEICRVGRQGIVDRDDPRYRPALDDRARSGMFKGELTCIRKDGTKFPAEVSSVILDGGSRSLSSSATSPSAIGPRKSET